MHEVHITIAPVRGEQLELAKGFATLFGFKIANLLMQRPGTGEAVPSVYDTFMTGHFEDYDSAEGSVRNIVRALKKNGFDVWRYKIELIVLDSRYQSDPLKLLS